MESSATEPTLTSAESYGEGRLHYHLGVAGLPHMERLADTLVQHQAEMRRGGSSLGRT